MVDDAKARLLPGVKAATQPKARRKRHVEKIAPLSRIARPQFNADGGVKLDGLVKAAPVVQERVAQRSRTKSHAKGDMTTKNDHVDSEACHSRANYGKPHCLRGRFLSSRLRSGRCGQKRIRRQAQRESWRGLEATH